MSNLDRFKVSGGYSLGSILPQDEEIIKSLGKYHPPINSDPKKYQMSSDTDRSGDVLLFKGFSTGDWTPTQIALFQKTQFKDKNVVDADSIELIQGTTFDGYTLTSCVMTRYENSSHLLFQETLSWTKNGQSFNTYWFWRPQ